MGWEDFAGDVAAGLDGTEAGVSLEDFLAMLRRFATQTGEPDGWPATPFPSARTVLNQSCWPFH